MLLGDITCDMGSWKGKVWDPMKASQYCQTLPSGTILNGCITVNTGLGLSLSATHWDIMLSLQWSGISHLIDHFPAFQAGEPFFLTLAFVSPAAVSSISEPYPGQFDCFGPKAQGCFVACDTSTSMQLVSIASSTVNVCQD